MILKSLTNFEKVTIITSFTELSLSGTKKLTLQEAVFPVYFHIFYVYSTLFIGKIYICSNICRTGYDNCGKGNIIWHFELN